MGHIKKKRMFLCIVIGISILTAAAVIPVIAEKSSERKKMLQAQQEYEKQIPVMYERQLFADTELQEQVMNFSSPENIPELFRKHEEKLNSFVELCYSRRNSGGFFCAEYDDNKLTYFTTADSDDGNKTAIKQGTHEDITAFMDYAADSGLAFREWMIEVKTPRTVEGDKSELTITIYRGFGLEVEFVYYPDASEDYSSEYYGMAACGPLGGSKTGRINSHWYYNYNLEEGLSFWYPDYKSLGFLDETGNDEEDWELEKARILDEYETVRVRRLTPIEVFLFFTIKIGFPIMAAIVIFIVISRYIKRKKK